MNGMQVYRVYPTIPEPLGFLETLSRNLWWSWNKDAIELFRRVDISAWSGTMGNPVAFLSRVPQQRLDELAADEGFLAHLRRVEERFKARVIMPTDGNYAAFGRDEIIAYFSMEFGLHESLPLSAGGLGVLAGDHLKAASNLALPMAGVGLLYRQGYFRQFLDHHGSQQEAYPETDLFHMPVQRAKDRWGKNLRVSVAGPDGEILADVWKIRVGRIPLFLMDANIQENPPETRDVTARLYVAEGRVRLAQELLLGIGGMRALTAMGLHPKVCHMNEGHSAFSSLERLVLTMSRHGVDLRTAHEIVSRTTVFTTHTPVMAGLEEFPAALVRPCLEKFQDPLGVTVNEVLSWGQPEDSGVDGPFSMSILGLRMAQYCNGVSALHGQVARKMWAHVWPERPTEEIPISHVTNGVHVASFVSQEFSNLLIRYLGPDWFLDTQKRTMVDRIDEIYDDELWRAHELNRSRLIRACRKHMRRQYANRNAPQSLIDRAESVLDRKVLTVGFARRFATYKRATLLLQDQARLAAMIGSEAAPIQFIFAGKAHPNDDEGKQLIRELVAFAQDARVGHRFIFLEDYDIHLARHLVQGADVWLNNPRRPFEACGTSGMKAAVNGVLNLSILDGWWCEGYSKDRGWAVGQGEEYTDWKYQDVVESNALYNLLENEVIPCFYNRKYGEVPSEWVKKMKASMKMAIGDYSSQRMAAEYERRFYSPAALRMDALLMDDAAEAKRIASQSQRLRAQWSSVRISPPQRDPKGPYRVGEIFQAACMVYLGDLTPEEVDVELYFGPMQSADSLKCSETAPMSVKERLDNGAYSYFCPLTCHSAGRYGFTARVTPHGDDRLKFTPKLITWA